METLLGLDYPTWWFLVVGALFSGYAILDGFDFGAGAWHLFFKKELDRRVALNAVGPVWDGNEVWLVIGGGALFAGFPLMYASFFSSLYIPFMLFLVFIIFRAIAIEFRSKEPMKWWRSMWDVTYSISSIMLAFLLGVVLGNVLQGLAIDENYNYAGSGFFEFLNPYALLTGVTTLALFMMHGAIYLLLKTEGKMFTLLTFLLKKGMIFFMVSFGITTLFTLLYIPHLSDDFKSHPVMFLIPMLTFLISTLSPENNITIYNAASSVKSLKIMLTIVAIGGPLVAGYTIFVYRTFKGKVKLDETSY